MLNVLIIMGRITKNPEVRKSGETTIVNFDIAVDNIRKEADGTRGTTFLSVTCFNSVASSVAEFLTKGSKIAVRGAIQQRNFLRKDGTKGTAYEVIADSVEFLDKPNPDNGKEEPVEIPTQEDCEVKQDSAPKYDPFTGKPLKQEKK